MDYIAVLTHEHLDNGMFLNAFSKTLARKKKRGIVLHEDSEYTDRLIQTGMMREDARIRAVKDLNHRLVALFADQGISTIGLNGYQKKLITYHDSTISVDENQFRQFPSHPVLLISNLVYQQKTGKPYFAPLPDLVNALNHSLSIEQTFLFSTDEQSSVIKGEFPKQVKPGSIQDSALVKYIPESFLSRNEEYILTSAELF